MTPDPRRADERVRWYQNLPTLLGGCLLLVVGTFLSWWGLTHEGWVDTSAFIAGAVLSGTYLVAWRLDRRDQDRAVQPVEIALAYVCMMMAGYVVGALSVLAGDFLPLLNWHIPATPVGVSL